MSNGSMADLAGEVLKQATENMVNTESLVLSKVYKDTLNGFDYYCRLKLDRAQPVAKYTIKFMTYETRGNYVVKRPTPPKLSFGTKEEAIELFFIAFDDKAKYKNDLSVELQQTFREDGKTLAFTIGRLWQGLASVKYGELSTQLITTWVDKYLPAKYSEPPSKKRKL